ncbi:MAG: ATP-binding protein [Spirochaetales bacterium]|nr:ATP-binding protein [Spirochaetales bacterium]
MSRRLRVPLKVKILTAFALIVLASVSVAVATGNRLNRLRFDTISMQRDLGRARQLALVLGPWAQKSAQGEVVELPEALGRIGDFRWDSHDTVRNKMMPMMKMRRSDSGDDQHWMDTWMSSSEENLPSRITFGQILDRVIITDLEGEILLNTAGYSEQKYCPIDNAGEIILYNGIEVGKIYVGRMIPELPLSIERNAFREAGKQAWYTAGLIMILAMIMGLLLTRHIVQPIRHLNQAAKGVGEGDFQVRVPDQRRDEFGELGKGFNTMVSSLELADRQQKRMIADAAHELRTPVSLIRARIEMMEAGVYPLNGESLEALASEADRLTHLVGELRTLASLESDDFKSTQESLSPSLVVGNAVDAALPAIHRSGLSIEAQVEDHVVSFMGSRMQIHRLLTNLLSNAQRHARNRILVRAWNEDSELVFCVEDDGAGVPQEERERVFDRYYRLDASRSRDSGGSGLGLAICQQIAKTHGGKMTCEESSLLGGAAFLLRIPTKKNP